MDYYKDIDNTDEIKVIVKEYELEDVMKDPEDFGEMIGDLVDEHPHIKNLKNVLERMLIYAGLVRDATS